MTNQFNFNQAFGLRWYQRFDRIFLSICTMTFSGTIILILILANMNFSRLQYKAEQSLREEYKKLVSTLILEDQQQTDGTLTSPANVISEIDGPRISTAESRLQERKAIEEEVIRNSFLADSWQDEKYRDLPLGNDPEYGLPEIEVQELTRSYESIHFNNSDGRNRNQVNNFNANEYDEPMKNPFNYIVKRKGQIFIEFTEELMEDKSSEYGYRDPEEIERVVEKYQPMIEYCFQKEARINADLRGFVKVQFSISYEGYVLPESIRIINSSINSRRVEQCIKNYIKRWRDFERLAPEMGIARVVQKFIFN